MINVILNRFQKSHPNTLNGWGRAERPKPPHVVWGRPSNLFIGPTFYLISRPRAAPRGLNDTENRFSLGLLSSLRPVKPGSSDLSFTFFMKLTQRKITVRYVERRAQPCKNRKNATFSTTVQWTSLFGDFILQRIVFFLLIPTSYIFKVNCRLHFQQLETRPVSVTSIVSGIQPFQIEKFFRTS